MYTLRWTVTTLAMTFVLLAGATATAQEGADDPAAADETAAQGEMADDSSTDEASADDSETDDGATDEAEDTDDTVETDEDGFQTNQGVQQQDTTARAPAEFGMNIDLMLAAGLGSLLYPHIEPSIDVGLLPLGPVTFSVGGSADVGYCLLCGVVTALSNWRVNSWYWSLQGRALFHFNQLTRMAQENFNVDLYAGVTMGPQFYNFTLGYKPTNDEASANFVTFLGGPVFGVRMFGDSIGFFGYAELRYFIEAGFSETTVEIDNQEFTLTNDYRRGGSDITLGVGYRF